MMTRTTRKTVTFRRPFSMSAIEKVQPSGTYTVDTDEELIDGLSFLAYRRVATLLHSPSTCSKRVPVLDQRGQEKLPMWSASVGRSV